MPQKCIGDKVECERCGLKLLNWTDTDDALHEHATRRTHCPFIVSLYRKLGQTPPPKHPQYQHLQARLDSFVDWPRRYVPKTPEELAAAGFFYIGSADRVTCFQCGITLRDWEEEHDPVAEHQRYSEHCQFINKTDLNQLGVASRIVEEKKTEQSGGSPTSDAGRQKPGEPSGVSQDATGATNHIQDTTSTGASQDATVATDHIQDTTSTGASQDATVATNLIQDTTSTCATKQDKYETDNNLTSQTTTDDVTTSLCAATTSTQAEGQNQSSALHVPTTATCSDTNLVLTSSKGTIFPASQRLANENKLLKDRRTCRVCKTEIVSELFLPCGHLVTCSACAPKVTKCCVCGKTILGTVKVFFS
ncbi:baculoviral IAP repeat-containing protein 2-like [Haliotis rufescens]|uniref:baculoviral IAP repeat-containing protein 2-like n=1 Tax=Haliotis rufescens TaxID=6454 RepID=UPI00201F58F0|nr:baculoviral IAP repeat-containing protein 2-like [Haliotis rufescens]